MCRGKAIRFFDDEERALVGEICDLREREHAIVNRLLVTRTRDSIYKKIKAEQRRRCYLRAHAGVLRRNWKPWTTSELIVVAECVLDPKAGVEELFNRLGGERSWDSCVNYFYKFRDMNQQEVRKIANGEAC